ncbi:MAG TPA: C4-type zinc ribbon domain-containing protein [Capsulimonadaceae bacterium]|nr:C4-type zinc ribbon domain-containing protein [Capsulimonadaceae bacterium]
MATLRENLDSLLDLQKIDSERDRIQRQIATLDKGSAAQSAANSLRASLEEQRSASTKNHASLKDSELELATLEKKLKSYEDRMRSGSITSARDVANTEREINQLIRQRAKLDERILELMDENERLKTSVLEAETKAQEADRRHQTQVESSRAQREQLERQLAGLSRQRNEAAAVVADPALLKRYETIRARPASAGVAIARVEDFHCGGCHTQIGAQDANHAHDGSQLVLCDNCGRILA